MLVRDNVSRPIAGPRFPIAPHQTIKASTDAPLPSGLFFFQTLLGIYSCFPTKQHRAEYAEKREVKRARAAMLNDQPPEDYEWPKTAFDLKTPVPRTPGTTGGIKSPALNPMTPRTLAFNKLGGTKDLPLRTHFSTPNAPRSPTYALQSPGFERGSTLSSAFDRARMQAREDDDEEQEEGGAGAAPAMYFPPPPRVATK
jgi:hypothetical protein